MAPVRLADRRVFIYILKDVLRFGQIRYAHSPIALERKHGKLALAYYFYATQLSICPTDELAERIPYVLHTATSSLTEHDVMFDHIVPPARLSDDDSARRRYSFHALPIA